MAISTLRSVISETLRQKEPQSLTNNEFAAKLGVMPIRRMDSVDAMFYVEFMATGRSPWNPDRLAELAGKFDLPDEFVDVIESAATAPSKAERKRRAVGVYQLQRKLGLFQDV